VARIADPEREMWWSRREVLSTCSTTVVWSADFHHEQRIAAPAWLLRRNLTVSLERGPEAELERVIDLCGVREIINQFPAGLSAKIKEDGGNLSAGYSARIALARAMVGNPRILLLDEPTLNLDEATKRIFHEALLHYGGTVLLATCDPDEAALADVVWEMENGRIVRTTPGNSFRESIARPPSLPAWARVGSS
jgi:ABC-type bacteriocin/lantibiotic exporter with double-glycine peptidase domain